MRESILWSSKKRKGSADWNNNRGLWRLKAQEPGRDISVRSKGVSKAQRWEMEVEYSRQGAEKLDHEGRVCLEAVRGRWAKSGDERGWRLSSQAGELGWMGRPTENHQRYLGSGRTCPNWWFRKISLAMVRGMNWRLKRMDQGNFIRCRRVCKTKELPILQFSGAYKVRNSPGCSQG